MKRILLVIVAVLNFMTATEAVWAQTEALPEPHPPYLAAVPDYGHWTVTLKYMAMPSSGTPAATNAGAARLAASSVPAAPSTPPGSAAPAPADAPDGFPTTIDTIKTGELRGVVLTFANGTSKQFTCQGNWVLTSTPKGPQLCIVNSSWAPYIYYTTGFVLLDGVKINPSTFKETAKHNDIFAFHYQSGDVDVWIDPKTMLPMTVKQGGVEVSYQFLNPPPRPFPIPKDQVSLLEQETQAYQKTRSLR